MAKVTDGTLMIKLHHIRLHLRRLQWVIFLLALKKQTIILWTTYGREVSAGGPEGGLHQADSHKEMNSANIHSGFSFTLESDSLSLTPPDENTAWLTPWLRSCETKQRIQLHHAQTSDSWQLWDNKCVFFILISPLIPTSCIPDGSELCYTC